MNVLPTCMIQKTVSISYCCFIIVSLLMNVWNGEEKGDRGKIQSKHSCVLWFSLVFDNNCWTKLRLFHKYRTITLLWLKINKEYINRFKVRPLSLFILWSRRSWHRYLAGCPRVSRLRNCVFWPTFYWQKHGGFSLWNQRQKRTWIHEATSRNMDIDSVVIMRLCSLRNMLFIDIYVCDT